MASWEVIGTSIDAAHFLPTTGAEWTPRGAGDFNGDGRCDVPWQRDDGLVYAWQMNGGCVQQANAVTGVGNEWMLRGVGDLDGDLDDDIVWQRNSDGLVYVWLLNGATITGAGDSRASAWNGASSAAADRHCFRRAWCEWPLSATSCP